MHTSIHLSVGAEPIVRALERNMWGYNDALALLPRARSHRGADVSWVSTGTPILNRVYDARFLPVDVEARVADVLAHFQAWRAPFSWQITPSGRPELLGDFLEEHGFKPAPTWSGMAVELAALRPAAASDGFTIEEVVTREGIEEWTEVLSRANETTPEITEAFADIFLRLKSGFHVPWHLYLGRENGRAVATAGRFSRDGVAGIYWVATLQDARRRGYAGALVHAAVAQARERGDRLATLQSTAEAMGVYQRLGFTEQCTIGVYRWNP
jgi:GNAT superfamily N-acetyltransferase